MREVTCPSEIGGNSEVIPVFFFIAVLEFRSLLTLDWTCLTTHILDIKILRISPLLGNNLWLFLLKFLLHQSINQVVEDVGVGAGVGII